MLSQQARMTCEGHHSGKARGEPSLFARSGAWLCRTAITHPPVACILLISVSMAVDRMGVLAKFMYSLLGTSWYRYAIALV